MEYVGLALEVYLCALLTVWFILDRRNSKN